MKKKSVGDGDIKCPDCAKACKPASIDVGGEPIAGWRCACGYELIHPKDIEKAYLFMQARKRERVVISKRGNSYMITIPKAIADVIGIESGRVAEVFLKDARTITIVV
jgi:hypothetical protein